MDFTDFGWEYTPPEYDTGDYWFNGKLFVTKGVNETLLEQEIFFIYTHIIGLVQQNQGIDYLQIFEQKEKNYKLFFIDQVTKSALQNGEHPPEHNYCTLMFNYEY